MGITAAREDDRAVLGCRSRGILQYNYCRLQYTAAHEGRYLTIIICSSCILIYNILTMSIYYMPWEFKLGILVIQFFSNWELLLICDLNLHLICEINVYSFPDQDGAEPSPNSVAALNLIRLAAFLDRKFAPRPEDIFRTFTEMLSQHPVGLPLMLCAFIQHSQTPKQVLNLANFEYIFLQKVFEL